MSIDRLLSDIDNIIRRESGLSKRANITEKDVLQGDRADTSPAGVPAESLSGPLDKELTPEDMKKSNPVKEGYNPNASASYDLTKEREKQVSEKAAKLAEEILLGYQKAAQEEEKEEEEEETEEEKAEATREEIIKALMEADKEEEASSEEDKVSKEAGIRTFFKLLDSEGAPFLHKIASMIDPRYKAQLTYNTGRELAEHAMMKQSAMAGGNQEQLIYNTGREIAEHAMMKQSAMVEVKQAYDTGAYMAEVAIQKLAADLVAVRPVVQKLLAEDILTQEEKDSLINTLASNERLTPDVVREATKGLSNADQVAKAIIESMEGTQGINVVPEAAQAVYEPTQAPEVAGVDGGIGGDKKELEDELLIEAALRAISRKRKK